jgi:hypothetical protein
MEALRPETRSRNMQCQKVPRGGAEHSSGLVRQLLPAD